jgi:undecaprenyl diphosphate synthase
MAAASPAEPYADDDLRRLGLERAALPRHVAVIMDGNGRWARSRDLPRIEGHRRGVASVRACVREAARFGLEQLTLYCLSSENWKRPPHELERLLWLLEQYVVEERSEIVRQGLRFAIVGRREGLGPGALAEIDRTIAVARGNRGMRLCLALNYGSRAEIADAARHLAEEVRAGRLDPADIDEQHLAAHLDTAGMPDPDLVIRTAGEMRLSNFLLWQSSYAELWVTPKCWPDFRAPDLHEALRSFAARDRRFGGL